MNASEQTINSWAVTTPTQSVQPDLIAVVSQHPARGLQRGAKLPTLREAAEISRRIIAEQATEDFGTQLRALRMSPTSGGLINPRGCETFAYTHAGLQQLMSYVDVPRIFVAALEYLPPVERAA